MTATGKTQTLASKRVSVGVWTEWVPGARWTNEGMTRLLGYIIEGAAQSGEFIFRIIMIDALREEVRQDLASLSAIEGVDYTIECPNDSAVSNSFPELATFANRNVPVEGWIVLYPQFQHALLLDAPVAAIFPDGIPVAYPTVDAGAWGPAGYHVRWRDAVKTMLDGADRVITFSEHVAKDHGERLFGVPAEKVRVVPHAPPDLQHLAPYAVKRQRTPESRRAAADLLRAYATEHGIGHLADFPFEEVDYVAISTQDRVTKNIRIITEAVRRLIREERVNIKMFMTAPIHFGATWTPLPALLEREMFAADLISMTDLPRDVHAAFYHCAALAVHSSIFEGGRGVFPYYEAVSVGTPCLMGDGPHTQELIAGSPGLAPFVFDPNDAVGLAKLVQNVLANRDAVQAKQLAEYEILSKRTWQDVARDYVTAATIGEFDPTSRRRGGAR
ncbi:hypothetical protein [Brevundimonas naejangsanensis]|uniref:hypothetical protein n=1 Tax=Brevundimonas naejangsanensis TaxID=588932 RepID=UPI0002A2DABE|nr:hypothetical protein [Brevundimonas naejangsanensis]EKY25701.1 hypothetical protein HMPREF0185_02787 [Brevundimonas diminuta 470-4]